MLNKIPDSIINEVRHSHNIVDIVGEYVQLKKRGRNYFGLCPFHDEKTPSFSVTDEKQIFHCFGCGKGGNVITFLMEIEQFTFFEALRNLANRSGIKLPANAQEQMSSYSEEENIVLEASEWLKKYYHHVLKYAENGREGIDYFQSRAIDKETIDLFQLGYSPFNSDVTVQFLKEKGFHEQSLVKLGLLNRTEQGQLTDPFRGRIVFPIKNHLGKTVAFGGRAIEDVKPKYLNSPDNDLFHKGSILYNFHLAKRSIRQSNEVVIFEGYMDVITAYQANITNCIATLGTALTEYQANLLGRYVDTVILCYDGDEAGQAAAYEAALRLRKYRCNVKVASVGEGLDPDDYIRQHGGEKFKDEILSPSETFTKFYINYKKRQYNLTVESDRVTYLNDVIEHISTVESPIEREYYVQQLSDEFNVTVETFNNEINRHRNQKQTHQFKDKSKGNRYTNKMTDRFTANEPLPAYQNAERFLLAHMLMDDYVIEKVQAELGVQFNIDNHKVIAIHLYGLYEENEAIDISALIDRLEDDEQKRLVTELINLSIKEEVSNEVINDYIRVIQLENTDVAEINELKTKQKQAIKNNDQEEALKLAQLIIEMERQLKK